MSTDLRDTLIFTLGAMLLAAGVLLHGEEVGLADALRWFGLS